MAVAGRSAQTLKKMWVRWGSWHSAGKSGHTPVIERDGSLPIPRCSGYHTPLYWPEVSQEIPYAFITLDLWSPNSCDLNPVGYIIIIQQQVYQTKVQDVNDLRKRLSDVWAGVEQSVTDDAVSWPLAKIAYQCLHSSQKQAWVEYTKKISIEFVTSTSIQ